MLSAWPWKSVRDPSHQPWINTELTSTSAMHKAWPELLKKMRANKATATAKERQLVISARTWFCLYLFEHQSVFFISGDVYGILNDIQDVIRDRAARDSQG